MTDRLETISPQELQAEITDHEELLWELEHIPGAELDRKEVRLNLEHLRQQLQGLLRTA